MKLERFLISRFYCSASLSIMWLLGVYPNCLNQFAVTPKTQL